MQTPGNNKSNKNLGTVRDADTGGSKVGVAFFSPTCAYSRLIMPMWDQVAHKLEGKLTMYRVDVTRQSMADLAK